MLSYGLGGDLFVIYKKRRSEKRSMNLNIREAMKKGILELKVNKIESPNVKARLLMQYILKKSRQYIIVRDDEELTKKQEEQYFLNINKLKNNTPIQHITNIQEFMKMNFYVDKNVLIPRQDTEILVEEVIKIANQNNYNEILDVCTGSGTIAVSLAKYIEGSKITAIDISKEALKIADKNAKINDVDKQIKFCESDMFEKVEKKKYDILVSNPPYISKKEIKKLNKDVLKEPLIALDGGETGLDFYEKIIREAYDYIKYDGYLCLEIGYDQKIDVIELLENQKMYKNIYCKKDLYGNDRIIVAKIGG